MSKEFKKYINNTGYNVLGKIPFDLAIPEAMSFAKPIVENSPDSKASLATKDIYKHLKELEWDDI